MLKDRIENSQEVEKLNRELFGENSIEVDKAITFLPQSKNYIGLDSDTDEFFDDIIEEEFIGTISFSTDNFRFQFSDDNKAVLFSEIKESSSIANLAYIIASLDSDVATQIRKLK